MQCFGWHKWPDGQFTGVLAGAVVSLRNVDDVKSHKVVEYTCHGPLEKEKGVDSALHSLFQTNVRDVMPAIATACVSHVESYM